MASYWRLVVTSLLTCSVTCADLPQRFDNFRQHHTETDVEGWTPLTLNETKHSQVNGDEAGELLLNTGQINRQFQNPTASKPSQISPTGTGRPSLYPARSKFAQLNPIEPQRLRSNPLWSGRPHTYSFTPTKVPTGTHISTRMQANSGRQQQVSGNPARLRGPTFGKSNPNEPHMHPGNRRQNQRFRNQRRRPQTFQSNNAGPWRNNQGQDIWFDPKYADNHRWVSEPVMSSSEPVMSRPGRRQPFNNPWIWRHDNDPDRLRKWLFSGHSRRSYSPVSGAGKMQPWRASRRSSSSPNIAVTPSGDTSTTAGAVGIMSLFVSTLTVLYMANSLMGDSTKTVSAPLQNVASSFWDIHGKIFGSEEEEEEERQLQNVSKVVHNDSNAYRDELDVDARTPKRNNFNNTEEELTRGSQLSKQNVSRDELNKIIDILKKATINTTSSDTLNKTLSTQHNDTSIIDNIIVSRNKRSLDTLLTQMHDMNPHSKDAVVTGRQFDPISQIAISAGMLLGAYVGYSFINEPTPQNKNTKVKKNLPFVREYPRYEVQEPVDDFDVSIPRLSEEDISELFESVNTLNSTLNNTLLGSLWYKDVLNSTGILNNDYFDLLTNSLKPISSLFDHEVNENQELSLDLTTPSYNILASNNTITSTNEIPFPTNPPKGPKSGKEFSKTSILSNLPVSFNPSIPQLTYDTEDKSSTVNTLIDSAYITTNPPHIHTSPLPVVNLWGQDSSDEERIILKVIPGGQDSSPIPVSELSPYLTHITTSDYDMNNTPDLYSLVHKNHNLSHFSVHSNSHGYVTSPKPSSSSESSNSQAYMANNVFKPPSVFFRPEIFHPEVSTQSYQVTNYPVLRSPSSTTTPTYSQVLTFDYTATTDIPKIDATPSKPLHLTPQSLVTPANDNIAYYATPNYANPSPSHIYEELSNRPHTIVNNQYGVNNHHGGTNKGLLKWQKIDTIPPSNSKSPDRQVITSLTHHTKDHTVQLDHIPIVPPSSTTPLTIPGYRPAESNSQSSQADQSPGPSYHMNQNYKLTQRPVHVHHKATEGHVIVHHPSSIHKDSIPLEVTGSQVQYGSTYNHKPNREDYISQSNLVSSTRPLQVEQKFPIVHQHSQRNGNVHVSSATHKQQDNTFQDQQSGQISYINNKPYESNYGSGIEMSQDPSKLIDKDTFDTLLQLAKREWQTLQRPQHPTITQPEYPTQGEGISQYTHNTAGASFGSSRPGQHSYLTSMTNPAGPHGMTSSYNSKGPVYTHEYQHPPSTEHLNHGSLPDFDMMVTDILQELSKAPANQAAPITNYGSIYGRKSNLGKENQRIEDFKQNLRLLFEMASKKGLTKEDFLTASTDINKQKTNFNDDSITRHVDGGMDLKDHNSDRITLNADRFNLPESHMRPHQLRNQDIIRKSNNHEPSRHPSYHQPISRPSFAQYQRQHMQINNTSRHQPTASSDGLVTWTSLANKQGIRHSITEEQATPSSLRMKDSWSNFGNIRSSSPISQPVGYIRPEFLGSSQSEFLVKDNMRTRPSLSSAQPFLTSTGNPLFAFSPRPVTPSVRPYSLYPTSPSSSGFPITSFHNKRYRGLEKESDPNHHVIRTELNFERMGRQKSYHIPSKNKEILITSSPIKSKELHPIAKVLSDMLNSYSDNADWKDKHALVIGQGQNIREELPKLPASSIEKQPTMDVGVISSSVLNHRTLKDAENVNSPNKAYTIGFSSIRSTTTTPPHHKASPVESQFTTPIKYILSTLTSGHDKASSGLRSSATSQQSSSNSSNLVSHSKLPSPSLSFLLPFSKFLGSPHESPSINSTDRTSSTSFTSQFSQKQYPSINHNMPASPSSYNPISYSITTLPTTTSFLDSANFKTSSSLYSYNSPSPNSRNSPFQYSNNSPSSDSSNSPSANSKTSPMSYSKSPPAISLMSNFLCRNADYHRACAVCMEEVGQRPECLLRQP